MLICEILRAKQPDVLCLLCKHFKIDEKDFQGAPGEVGYFDPAWEMTHDSEDRYLNYSSRVWKL